MSKVTNATANSVNKFLDIKNQNVIKFATEVSYSSNNTLIFKKLNEMLFGAVKCFVVNRFAYTTSNKSLPLQLYCKIG